MNVVKSVCDVYSTAKRFIDTKACQFLVDYPFLILSPSALQQSLRSVIGWYQITLTFPGRNTSSVGGMSVLHPSGGNTSTEIVSGGAGSMISGTSEGSSGTLAQTCLRDDSPLLGVSPSASAGIVS